MKSENNCTVKKTQAVLICAAVLLVVGCKSIGPGTVKRDRLYYSTALADSRKEQLLLNIVRTRYADPPAFLEIASVVAGYTLEAGLNLNGQFSPESLRGDTFAGGGVSGKYTDRPTISYSPMTGEKFARSLMAPVPLDALWFVIQGGAPADFILGLTVHVLEGRRNSGIYGGQLQTADPEFARLLGIMRELQQSGVTESQITRQGDRAEIWIQFYPPEPAQPVLAKQLAELKKLLGIPAGMDRVKVVFGPRDADPGVIAVRTRSLMQILSTLGMGVQIPPEDLAQAGVVPVEASQAPGGFTVHCSKEKPDDAFVTVPYVGHWFWIERKDLASKMTLAAVVVLFNFLEGGEKVSPVLTIPTN